METTLLQNAMFELGNTIGYYSAWALTLIMIALTAWVMWKYLDTSDLN